MHVQSDSGRKKKMQSEDYSQYEVISESAFTSRLKPLGKTGLEGPGTAMQPLLTQKDQVLYTRVPSPSSLNCEVCNVSGGVEFFENSESNTFCYEEVSSTIQSNNLPEIDGLTSNESAETEDRPTTHIKRPMNSFMVFSNKRRKVVRNDNPGKSNSDVSKLLGEEWKRLTVEEKEPFIKMANELREKHMENHPGYRYRPKRKRKLTEKFEECHEDIFSSILSGRHAVPVSRNRSERVPCVQQIFKDPCTPDSGLAFGKESPGAARNIRIYEQCYSDAIASKGNKYNDDRYSLKAYDPCIFCGIPYFDHPCPRFKKTAVGSPGMLNHKDSLKTRNGTTSAQIPQNATIHLSAAL